MPFVINFSRFKDILDLGYKVLYFNSMKKTHILIETNIMGEKVRLIYATIRQSAIGDRITATAPCCLFRGGLSWRSSAPIACCPPHVWPRKIKFVRSGQVENGKSALCGLYISFNSCLFFCQVPAKAEEITIPADVTPERVPTHIVDFSCMLLTS